MSERSEGMDVALDPLVGLERYGIEWRGPHMPIALPMPDGYWTPWHLAQQEIDDLRASLRGMVDLYRAFDLPTGPTVICAMAMLDQTPNAPVKAAPRSGVEP